MDLDIGDAHAMCASKGGDCFVWGSGDSGQLGEGKIERNFRFEITLNDNVPPVKSGIASLNSMA